METVTPTVAQRVTPSNIHLLHWLFGVPLSPIERPEPLLGPQYEVDKCCCSAWRWLNQDPVPCRIHQMRRLLFGSCGSSQYRRGCCHPTMKKLSKKKAIHMKRPPNSTSVTVVRSIGPESSWGARIRQTSRLRWLGTNDSFDSNSGAIDDCIHGPALRCIPGMGTRTTMGKKK